MAGGGGVEGRANHGLVSSSDDSHVLLQMDTDNGKASVSTASDRLLQARCFLTKQHPRILIALFGSFGLTATVLFLSAGHRAQYYGSDVPSSAVGKLVAMVSTLTDACSIVERDFEYHTHENLKVLVNVDSADLCCAECQRHPQCRVWIYGIAEPLVGDGMQLLARNCHLRAFNSSEQMKKIPRPGVVSGLLGVKAASAGGTSFEHPQHSNRGRQQQSNGSLRKSALALDEELPVIRMGLFEEVSEDNVEWQVVSSTAPVLLGPDLKNAIIIGEKWMGEVVTGQRVDSQVHLTHDFGFMPVEDANGTAYLKKRTVRYRKILSGSCAESGMTPINDAKVCTAAAVALGYLDQHVTAYPGRGTRPEGCYLHAGQVWLSLAERNRGRGALGSSWPICSNGSYPTTTSTITTTTKTTTTTQTMTTQNETLWGYPSLFCFEVVCTTSLELSLAQQQYLRRMSVFACDESLIFSNGKEPQELGRVDDGLTISTVVVTTLTSGHKQADENRADPWPSTKDFLEIWSFLQQDGRVLNHDWTAKVHPDVVFFPDRLRNQLKAHTHQPDWSLYVANCNKHDLPGFSMPLEIFSRTALRTFFHEGHKCQANMAGELLAEASFMSRCMDMLGVGRVYADNLLSDERCTYSPCSDGMKAAYYKYSDASPTGAWFRCWNESTGFALPKDEVANSDAFSATASKSTFLTTAA